MTLLLVKLPRSLVCRIMSQEVTHMFGPSNEPEEQPQYKPQEEPEIKVEVKAEVGGGNGE